MLRLKLCQSNARSLVRCYLSNAPPGHWPRAQDLQALQLAGVRLVPSQHELRLVEQLEGLVQKVVTCQNPGWEVRVDGSVGKGTFVPGSDIDLVVMTGQDSNITRLPTRKQTSVIINSLHSTLEEDGLHVLAWKKNDRALIFKVKDAAGAQMGMDVVFDKSSYTPVISVLTPKHKFSPAVKVSVKLLKHAQRLRKDSGCGVPHLPGHMVEALCCGTEQLITSTGMDPQQVLAGTKGVPGAVLFLAVLQVLSKSSLTSLKELTSPNLPQGCHLYNFMSQGQHTAWQAVATHMLDVWDTHAITTEEQVALWLSKTHS